METCTAPPLAIKLRRPAPRPKVTLGDKVLALRQLGGSARAKAEAQFLKDAEPFMRRCAAWYFGPDLDHDDVMATARLAVWSCVLDWDPARGAPFDTHARWKVRTELGKLLRGSRMVRGRAPEDFVERSDSRYVEEVATKAMDFSPTAADEVQAALLAIPDNAAEVIRAQLRGEVVDEKESAAARELLGWAVLRRRREVAR